MKRRGFLKSLAGLCALPFVAPLVALCKPRPKANGVIDWSMNPIAEAAGHVKHPPEPRIDVLERWDSRGHYIKIGDGPWRKVIHYAGEPFYRVWPDKNTWAGYTPGGNDVAQIRFNAEE